MKKWLVISILVICLLVLYLIEFRRVDFSGTQELANLDDLVSDETGQLWEPFYRVRVTILDGQNLRFSIPRQLEKMKGEEITIPGAAAFYGSGSRRKGDSVTVTDFFLLPTAGLAEACVIQPDIELRWTIGVELDRPWVLHFEEMIQAMVRVHGCFRIDTTRPFEPAFYLDHAMAELIPKEEDY